jgi:hypothetical protein
VCGDLVRSSTGIDEGRAPEGEDGQKCKLEVLTLSLNLFIMSGFSRPKRLWGDAGREPVGVDGTGKFGRIPALNDGVFVVSSLTNRSSNGVGAQVNSCE